MRHTRRLMVMVAGPISSFIDKGEVIDRYYNPGELFDEVHIVIPAKDEPDKKMSQKMAGRAKLYIHTIPVCPLVKAVGLFPRLLVLYARPFIDLADTIRPNLIRCHGADVNVVFARIIKEKRSIPFLVSLHINPDANVWGPGVRRKDRLLGLFYERIARYGLKKADRVLPVYKPILDYLERIGVSAVDVCYNVINPSHLIPKTDYHLGRPVRVLSVGRQLKEKNPDKLIEAVKELPGVELTLVGDGPFHSHLTSVTKKMGLENRVHFIPSIPNDQLARKLHTFDIFSTHTEYFEISKSVLEPMIAGVPVVLNKRTSGKQVPELLEAGVILVENTADSYKKALTKLIEDGTYREAYGRHLFNHAKARWSPEKTEKKYTDLYRSFLVRQDSV